MYLARLQRLGKRKGTILGTKVDYRNGIHSRVPAAAHLHWRLGLSVWQDSVVSMTRPRSAKSYCEIPLAPVSLCEAPITGERNSGVRRAVVDGNRLGLCQS